MTTGNLAEPGYFSVSGPKTCLDGRISAGEKVKLKDLYYGAMLPSGAECCLGLAKYLAGSEEKFAVLMNQKAKEIGMKHTNFVNSTGLHDPQHVSTAEDLMILLRYALENPRFRKVFEAMQYRRKPLKSILRDFFCAVP